MRQKYEMKNRKEGRPKLKRQRDEKTKKKT